MNPHKHRISLALNLLFLAVVIYLVTSDLKNNESSLPVQGCVDDVANDCLYTGPEGWIRFTYDTERVKGLLYATNANGTQSKIEVANGYEKITRSAYETEPVFYVVTVDSERDLPSSFEAIYQINLNSNRIEKIVGTGIGGLNSGELLTYSSSSEDSAMLVAYQTDRNFDIADSYDYGKDLSKSKGYVPGMQIVSGQNLDNNNLLVHFLGPDSNKHSRFISFIIQLPEKRIISLN